MDPIPGMTPSQEWELFKQFLPSNPSQNRGPALLAVIWPMVGVTMLIVALRIYTKWRMRRLDLSDYTMIVATILFIIPSSFSTVAIHFGFGRHLKDIENDEHKAIVLLMNEMNEPFTVMSLFFTKASITILLVKLLPPKSQWRRWFLWINLLLFFITSVEGFTFVFFLCNPPRATWDPKFLVEHHAKCRPMRQLVINAIWFSAHNAYLDFVLALLPITIVYRMNMSMKKKIACCILLGLVAFSGICAVVRSVFCSEFGDIDLTYAIFHIYAWTCVELTLNICCASLPFLKPLWDRLLHCKPLRPLRLSSNAGFSMRSSTDARYHGNSSGHGSRLGDSSMVDEFIGTRGRGANFTRVQAGTFNSVFGEGWITVETTFDVKVETNEDYRKDSIADITVVPKIPAYW